MALLEENEARPDGIRRSGGRRIAFGPRRTGIDSAPGHRGADPGHGGEDPGASAAAARTKERALAIGKKLIESTPNPACARC
jgi:hypothetical protein